MDKVAKQPCLDFMACCTLPFYDLESKRIPRILLSCCIGQVHRHTQPHLLLLLLPSSTAAAAAAKKNRPSMRAFFSLSLYPKSQLGNPRIISSSSFCAVGVILRSILRNGNPSASTPGLLARSVGSGKRVKRPRPFFLFTRTETSDYLYL